MTPQEKTWADLYSLKAPWEKLPLKQKIDVIQSLLHFLALTVMVFARRRLGYRTLNPVHLLVTGFILIVIQNAQLPYVSAPQPSYWPYPLTLYVVAMLVWAFVQRRLRWREMVRGVHWHTYSRGVSFFSFLPLRSDIVARFVDPTVVMIVALFTWYFVSTGLGGWLMIGAIAFLVSELRFYDLVLGQTLDLLDGLEENRVQSEVVMSHTKPTTAPARTIEQTAGIPTGIGDDLIAAVARRRAEAEAQEAGEARAAA